MIKNLTPMEIREFKFDWKKGAPYKVLMHKYGVSERTVCRLTKELKLERRKKPATKVQAKSINTKKIYVSEITVEILCSVARRKGVSPSTIKAIRDECGG